MLQVSHMQEILWPSYDDTFQCSILLALVKHQVTIYRHNAAPQHQVTIYRHNAAPQHQVTIYRHNAGIKLLFIGIMQLHNNYSHIIDHI